jgi:hypothetical protein
MKWSSIADRAPVLQAIAEFDGLGRDAFLAKYGFGRSTHLYVTYEGNLYDIKALAGATRGYADANAGPLRYNEFSSGKPLVDLFRRLGFDVVDQADTTAIEEAEAFRVALEEVLAGYLAAKSTPIGATNPIWIAMERAATALKALVAEYPHIKVVPSVGKGNWAEVPWISLLDDRETMSTRQGVYAVYLLRADMTGVYTTLNQGVTQLRETHGWRQAQETLKANSGQLRERYRGQLQPKFTSADGIDLRARRGGLGSDYEASTIAWRLYESGAIPPAHELLEDLYRLLDVYNDYASREIPVNNQTSSSALADALRAQGYTFEPWQVAAFVQCVRTKPFAILAGISGTGKTKLPLLVAEITGAHAELIPVRPDWTDSADLLGYTNLQGKFVPGRLLELARAASSQPERQFFAVLDEMNLARVEQYFAEVLSHIEDRRLTDTGFQSRAPLIAGVPEPWSTVHLPGNLVIVGTVNMDETTHGFSRKVLDRAFTLEMSEVNLAARSPVSPDEVPTVAPWSPDRWRSRALRPSEIDSLPTPDAERVDRVVKVLTEVNQILVIAQMQVGYRIRDEVAMFLIHAAEDDAAFTSHGSRVDPLDLALQMKVLPRIQGGSSAIRAVLRQLITWACDSELTTDDERPKALVSEWAAAQRPAAHPTAVYPRTAARLCLMWERLATDGFTSFWL